MARNAEIPGVTACLRGFFETIPPGTLAGVANVMEGVLGETSDQMLGRVDGFIREFEQRASELLGQQDRLRQELRHLEEIVRAADTFLAAVECPELAVLKDMWDERRKKVQTALAKIDSGPMNEALRKYRELKSDLSCQQANARKVRDFIGSLQI